MLEVSTVSSIAEVAPEEWDALAGQDNPFVEHAFLGLLERSGSVGPSTGWLPRHLIARSAGRLVGAMPAYVKTDSFGEYIFDWAIADAAERAGLPYYPKLVVAVPFTPATGPRILLGNADHSVAEALLLGLERLAAALPASSAHLLFTLEREASFLAERGLIRRSTVQYHFRNPGYGSFEDFLERLRAPARKQIRRERRRVAEQGVEIEVRAGGSLGPEEWREVDRLYRLTGSRKWGRPYLTPRFFELAGSALGDRAVVFFARKGSRVVAAALSFEKGPHLYGRYWGASEWVDCLHFELCYYQHIDYAIRTGKVLVEAGAQGEHKLKRGFEPVVVHSAHRFAHPGLSEAVRAFAEREREELREALPLLAQHVPFREGCTPGFPSLAGILLEASAGRVSASQ